ncbi:MAG TPA: V-type ATP synthase subunit E, partial [Trueperaceae bacterium]|nr:V-type ATP synthase subunit E [Trueperaceae bacterium]
MAALSSLLEKEASTEIEAIVAEGKKRAEEILSTARAEAEGVLAARARAVKTQREAGLVRARSAAQLEASSLKLRSQHEGVQSVFAQVQERIKTLVNDRQAYTGVFGTLLAEAIEGLGGTAVQAVEVAPGDVELAKAAAAKAGLTAAVTANDAVQGGVRLVTANRSAVENTLYGRLSALE